MLASLTAMVGAGHSAARGPACITSLRGPGDVGEAEDVLQMPSAIWRNRRPQPGAYTPRSSSMDLRCPGSAPVQAVAVIVGVARALDVDLGRNREQRRARSLRAPAPGFGRACCYPMIHSFKDRSESPPGHPGRVPPLVAVTRPRSRQPLWIGGFSLVVASMWAPGTSGDTRRLRCRSAAVRTCLHVEVDLESRVGQGEVRPRVRTPPPGVQDVVVAEEPVPGSPSLGAASL